MRRRGESSKRLLTLLVFTSLFACDIAGSGGSEGCLRVHQGDYVFPVKRVVKGSVSTRVTGAGTALVTEHIGALVGAIFETDDQGRAIIPLDTLGLGTITTTLGLFESELREVVLTLDLASLTVTFVEGSSPPRIRISVVDADVGVLSGIVAGSVNLILTQPDLACAIGNGPQARIARLSFDIELTLATDDNGAMDLSAEVMAVDIQDVAVDVSVDCALDECQDGCGECTIVCAAASLGAQVTTAVQALLDDLVDDIATWLFDLLADPVLDGVINDKPLAVEGTLDVAALARVLLPALHSVTPLGVLARPTGEAFRVSGTGDDVALVTHMDAGVDAAVAHPCVGHLDDEPIFEATPIPAWPETLADGGTYHAGIALSEAVASEALHATWKAGALCIDATSRDIAILTGGELVLRAATLELMLPGISAFAGGDAATRLSIRPKANAPPTLSFVDGDSDAPIRLHLEGVEMSVALFVAEGYQRVLAITSDFSVSMAVDALGGGRIGLRVSDIAVEGAETTFAGPFEAARLDLVVPFVVDLMTGTLGDISFDLNIDPTSLIANLTGIPLVPSLEAVSAADGWLQLFITAGPAAIEPAPVVGVQITEALPGALSVHTSGPPGAQVQLRIGRGGWTPWLDTGVIEEVSHPQLWLVGQSAVVARSRPHSGAPAGRPTEVATVTVSPPTDEAAATATSSTGCSSGPGPAALWALALLLFVGFRRLGGAAWAAAALLLLGLGGCGDNTQSMRMPCEDHAACPTGYLCIGELCEPTSACEADGDCCPGAECASGWCRPTTDCTTSEMCYGLGEVCEDGLCVPTPCVSDVACLEGLRCVGGSDEALGRCLVGSPCDGACAEDEACHVATGRCVPAACGGACTEGRVAIAVDGVSPMACSEPVCACAFSSATPIPSPGQEGRLLEIEGDLAMLSYDPTYGDLVWSTFEPDGDRIDHAVAGVPEDATSIADTDYRGGVTEPGPDLGRHPAAVLVAGDEAPHVAAWFQDPEAGRLHFARLAPTNGEVAHSYELPLEGVAGRFSCLTTDGATGALVGWVYVETDATGTRSRLLRLNAQSATPGDITDWEVTVLSEAPRPLYVPTPCGGACELLEVCVQGEMGGRCVPAVGEPTCEGGCPAHQVCAQASDDEEPACWPRIYPETAVQEPPSGAGLFVDCSPTPEGAFAAWYDADAGAVAAVRGPGGAGDVFWLDGTPEPLDGTDRGQHVAVTAGQDGEVTVLYQDVIAGRVLAATQATETSPWTSEVVHDGMVPSGLHALGTGIAVARLSDGREVAVYGDGTTGALWMTARGEGDCWHRVLAIATGTVVWPSVRPTGDDAVGITAVQMTISTTLSPQRELLSLALPRPSGTCASP